MSVVDLVLIALALLASLESLVATGFPVLVGTSRKGFLGRLTGGAPLVNTVQTG